MKKNMGKTDRLLRSFISLAMIILAIYLVFKTEIIAGIILMFLAGILGVSSISGCCPMYLPFGFTTLRASATRITPQYMKEYKKNHEEATQPNKSTIDENKNK